MDKSEGTNRIEISVAHDSGRAFVAGPAVAQLEPIGLEICGPKPTDMLIGRVKGSKGCLLHLWPSVGARVALSLLAPPICQVWRLPP